MTTEQFEAEFWRILAKNRLADLSQFHKVGFHDEVPLYTRAADIEFMSNLGRAKTNTMLLAASLKYLRSVIAYEEHRQPFFAAITVWNYSKDDPIIPNLFVWLDSIEVLQEALSLSDVKTPFGAKLKTGVVKLHLPDEFDVFEDTATMPEMSRVFIGPVHHPYESVVPLSRFLQPALAA